MSSAPEKVREVSSKRVAANQKNALKSTGPRTVEGKAASRRNSMKHGHRSKIVVAPHEDPEHFDLHFEGFHDALKPRDAVEVRIVNDVIASSWRLDRAIACDSAVVSKQVYEAVHLYDIEREDQFAAQLRGLASNPKKVTAQLRTTTQGCDWMINKLALMIETLEVRHYWYPSERDSVLNIFGLTTEDLFHDSLAFDIVEAFVSAGWSTESNGDVCRVQALIRTPAPKGMATWEYRHRVTCLATMTQYADPVAARIRLLALLRPEIEKLKERRESLVPREHYIRVTARDRAMVDTSLDGTLRNRYESMHRRDFQKSLKVLQDYRKSNADNEFRLDREDDSAVEAEVVEAPNEPIMVKLTEVPEAYVKPPNGFRDGVHLEHADSGEDVVAEQKQLGIPWKPLDQLIDASGYNLQGLLELADELEAEENAKLKAAEMSM